MGGASQQSRTSPPYSMISLAPRLRRRRARSSDARVPRHDLTLDWRAKSLRVPFWNVAWTGK